MNNAQDVWGFKGICVVFSDVTLRKRMHTHAKSKANTAHNPCLDLHCSIMFNYYMQTNKFVFVEIFHECN